MPPSEVRLVPKLSIAPLRRGLDKELAMWYCLRAINCWGSGRLDLEAAVAGLIAIFGYSISTAYRILGNGDGVFWAKRPMRNVNDLQIEIYGVKRVARYSGYHSRRCLIEIPILKSVRYERRSVIQL